jgi:hypothetical protein
VQSIACETSFSAAALSPIRTLAPPSSITSDTSDIGYAADYPVRAPSMVKFLYELLLLIILILLSVLLFTYSRRLNDLQYK